MTGTLALLGGAEWTDGVTLDAALAAESSATEVTILPTATAYENPGARVERAREAFAALGLSVKVLPVYQRAQAMEPEWATEAAASKWLYLTGGSPMHLRSVLFDTPLWDAVTDAFEAGAILAGAGEAASVFCDALPDPRGGAFTVGLGLINTLTVLPRYERWTDETLHRTVSLAPRALPVVGLDARTALVRSGDGTWRTEGPGRVIVYVDGRQGDLADLPAELSA